MPSADLRHPVRAQTPGSTDILPVSKSPPVQSLVIPYLGNRVGPHEVDHERAASLEVQKDGGVGRLIRLVWSARSYSAREVRQYLQYHRGGLVVYRTLPIELSFV